LFNFALKIILVQEFLDINRDKYNISLLWL